MEAPGPWPGWTWMEELCHMPSRHLEANLLAHAAGGKGLGLLPPAATLAGASGSPFVAIFGARSSLL